MKCDHKLKDIAHFIWTKCFILAYFIDIVLNLYNDILNWLPYLYHNPSKLEGGILESTCLSVHLSGCLSVHLCRQHGFQSINEVCFWNFNLKFHVLVDCGHRQKPIDFQQCHFQNGCLAILDCLISGLDCLVTILDFFGFRTPIFSSTIFVYMRDTRNIELFFSSQMDFPSRYISLFSAWPPMQSNGEVASWQSVTLHKGWWWIGLLEASQVMEDCRGMLLCSHFSFWRLCKFTTRVSKLIEAISILICIYTALVNGIFYAWNVTPLPVIVVVLMIEASCLNKDLHINGYKKQTWINFWNCSIPMPVCQSMLKSCNFDE